MATSQAKIGWKTPRMRENKNYRSVPFYRLWNRKFEKNSKKIQNIKKYHFAFISRQYRLGMAKTERKYKLSFRSYTIRNRKFQKK